MLDPQKELWGWKKIKKREFYWGFQKDQGFMLYPVPYLPSVYTCSFLNVWSARHAAITGISLAQRHHFYEPRTWAFGHPKPRAHGFRKELESSSFPPVSVGVSALRPLHPEPHAHAGALGEPILAKHPAPFPPTKPVSSSTYCCFSSCSLGVKEKSLPQIST